MNRKGIAFIVVLLVVATTALLIVLAACQPGPSPTIPVPPASTSLPIHKSPTSIPRPTFTPSPLPTLVPTLTPTTTPLPPVNNILQRFETEIQPQLDRLNNVPKAPEEYTLPSASDWRIHFLPLDDRSYYVQYLLMQDKVFGNPAGTINIFITYTYQREGCLGYAGMSCGVQNIAVLSRLFVEENGTTYFLEELPTWAGGAGSSSDWEMVEHTVHPFKTLGEKGSEIEEILELLVGYTCGLDPDQTLVKAFDYPGLQTRMAILRQAIQSTNWSDREFAAYSLYAIGPDAAEMIPELIKALHDEEYHVIWGAVYALDAIGPAASAAVPDLIVVAQATGLPPQCLAISTLGKLGKANEVVPALIPVLEARQDCLESAARVLRRYGTDSIPAVPALIAIIEDTSLREDDRRQAISTLNGITGQKCEEDIDCWRSWWEEHKP